MRNGSISPATSADTKGPVCDGHPLISIIVCTLGDRPAFWDCLRSLLTQTCTHREVLVVLNGAPREEFARVLALYPVRVLHEPRLGVSAARNCAVAQADGEVLAFVDDDVLVRPDWLHEILKGFENPSICCVTGLVVPEEPGPHSQERSNRYYESRWALSAWTLSPSDPDWLRRAISEPAGFGCNMAFRKSFLENHAFFPEDLGAGSLIGGGDEYYMFLQTLKRGFRICHNPHAIVTHVYESSGRQQKRRSEQLYAGSVAFALKLFFEEKGLRLKIIKWIFFAVRRRFQRVISTHRVSSEPQEPLTTPEKLRAYMRGPWVYWESRRMRNRLRQ